MIPYYSPPLLLNFSIDITCLKNTDALILPPEMLVFVLSMGILKSPHEIQICSFAKKSVISKPASPEPIRNVNFQVPANAKLLSQNAWCETRDLHF